MNCPTCHTPNEPDARFCKNCGALLSPDIASPTRSSRRLLLLGSIIGGGLLVVGIVAVVLYLLFRSSPQNEVDSTKGITLKIDPTIGMTWSPADEEAQLTLPPEGLTGPLTLRARAIPAAQFPPENPEDDSLLALVADQLPDNLSVQSAVYRFELVEGPPPTITRFNILFPSTASAPHALDLYAWEEETGWHWLAGHANPDSGELSAQLESLPEVVALMQSEPNIPVVTVDLGPETTLPAAAEEALTERLLAGFYLQPDGSLKADESLLDVETTATLIPSLRNWREEGTMTVDTGMILADPTLRQRQIDAIVGLALAGGYPTVQLDYRGLDPNQRQIFSDFIIELAMALDEQKRSLLVRVETPVRISDSNWETGAYDWTIIGRAADRLQVPLPTDPIALAEGQTEALLTWAVGQVERAKLQPFLSLYSLDMSSEGITTVPTTQTLAYLGPLHTTLENDSVEPGDEVTLSLAGLNSGVLEIDSALNLLHFVGPDETGQTRQFYLPTTATLSRWLQQITNYNLAGVALEGISAGAPHSQTWPLLQGYRQTTLPAVETEPIWVWQVTALDTPAEPLKVETRPITEISYTWAAPNRPDEYQVTVALSMDGGNSILPIARLTMQVEEASAVTSAGDKLDTASEGDTLSLPTPASTPTSTPAPASTPTPTPEAPRPILTPTPLANNCPDSRATITSPINGTTIRGIVPFMGTAYLDTLIYYKFEYKPADSPTWQYLTKFDYTWVTNDKLMDFYTSTVAPGVYDFRLIVVDKSGNFPPPCEIRVTVQR